MRVVFEDFNNTAKLDIEVDESNKDIEECCEQINSFFSGNEDRLNTAGDALGIDYCYGEGDHPEVTKQMTIYAGLLMILHSASRAAHHSDIENTWGLENYFSKGQEGFPSDFSKYGITIHEWTVEQLDSDNFEGSIQQEQIGD